LRRNDGDSTSASPSAPAPAVVATQELDLAVVDRFLAVLARAIACRHLRRGAKQPPPGPPPEKGAARRHRSPRAGPPQPPGQPDSGNADSASGKAAPRPPPLAEEDEVRPQCGRLGLLRFSPRCRDLKMALMVDDLHAKIGRLARDLSDLADLIEAEYMSDDICSKAGQISIRAGIDELLKDPSLKVTDPGRAGTEYPNKALPQNLWAKELAYG